MFDVRREGERAVVTPTADLVATVCPDLKRELRTLVEGGVREVTVDLGAVQVIDSVGIGVLIAAHNSLEKVQGRLLAVHASADVRRLFALMRLDQRFGLVGS